MRSFDDVFTVDGSPMLTPDEGVQLRFQDLDAASAGRDEGGFMHRMVVRSRVRSWSFTYGVLSTAELEYLQKLFGGKTTFRFRFDGGETTAYCSGEEVHLYSRARGVYKGMKFDIVEC